MAQIKVDFTKDEIDKAFHRLFDGLRAGATRKGHPKTSGPDPQPILGLPKEGTRTFRSETAEELGAEFMLTLRDSEAIPGNDTRPTRCVYAFKHSSTRNYIYVAMRGEHEILVPVTPEPFHRGFF